MFDAFFEQMLQFSSVRDDAHLIHDKISQVTLRRNVDFMVLDF